MKKNPFGERLAQFAKAIAAKKLDAALVCTEPNVKGLTGVDCDNAVVLVGADGSAVFHTDFRYIPMVERVAPWIKVRDLKKLSSVKATKLGFENAISVAKLENFKKTFKGARFVNVGDVLSELRAVKTPEELDRLRAAEKLNDEIWNEARKSFRKGMTELEMARIIRHMMIEKGEGEAFSTIVCVGANAAECHHVPDDTVWDGKEPILVDMGVKLDGYCSDMTRNIVPAKPSRKYKKIYDLVLAANMLGIESAKAGITAGALDRKVRRFLKKAGFEKEFGHSLGHGVGIEIHEAPGAHKKSEVVLKAGMSLTIEPGIYIPGELGVRIEDLVLITETGCEVISHSAK
ncbi:MAG: aminopeptidase P family protein [Lentisphaerae bacterium]|nr:aminopeptidase P family protein [Lentisphaerota bacterium]